MAIRVLKPLHDSGPDERRYRDQWRGNANERGYTYRWQQYSHRFLKTHPLCAICEKQGRVEVATVVDHIVPVTGPDDPLFWDFTNHQALSVHCHTLKTKEDQLKLSASTHPQSRIVVVYGLPGSGKTTHVLQTMKRGDLIVDMDRLAAAISGLPLHDHVDALLPFVASARDAIYARLHRPSHVGTAWIITTKHEAAQQLARDFGVSITEMKVDETERLRRLQQRGHEQWGELSKK